MDLVDKRILLEMQVNCRISFQTLAKRLNLSVNAIKKRMTKLKETGMLRGYYIYPSLAMLDAEWAMAIVEMENPTINQQALDIFGSSPIIQSGSLLTDGKILLFGHYQGSKGLDELGLLLRQVEGVKNVEFHTILAERGIKCDLKAAQVKVLQCLLDDARMSVTDIANRTRLTPRRIRKTLDELGADKGTSPETYIRFDSLGGLHPSQACFHFRIIWDLNAGGYTTFIIRITYTKEAEVRARIVDRLKQEYPLPFWYAYASAFDPVLFAVFMVEHIRDANSILSTINKIAGVTSARAIYGYPTKTYPGLMKQFWENLINQLETRK